MPRLIFATCALLILLFQDLVGEERSEKTGFRKVTWGMTKHEVMATEPGSPAADTPELLGYSGKVAEFPVMILYRFSDDRLVGGGYSFQQEYINKNSYITDYESLKSTLIGLYGDPTEDQTVWKSDLFRKDPNNWGMAVSVGNLAYRSEWQAGATKIVLTLAGENFELELLMFFYGPEFDTLMRDEREREARQNF
jgi:hypothetical protein